MVRDRVLRASREAFSAVTADKDLDRECYCCTEELIGFNIKGSPVDRLDTVAIFLLLKGMYTRHLWRVNGSVLMMKQLSLLRKAAISSGLTDTVDGP